MSEDQTTGKPKRKPGPRPKAVKNESFTVTFPRAGAQQLREHMRATGRNRSDLLWRAWRELPLTPRVPHGLEVVKCYRELVELVSLLRQLERAAPLGAVNQAKAQLVLAQAEQLLSTLNRGEMR